EQHFQLMLRAHRGKELHDLGDLTGAEAELRETLAQVERLGEVYHALVFSRAYLVRLLARTAPLNRADELEKLARDALSAGNPSLMGYAHGAIAEIKRRQGDLVGAEREARAGCEAVRQVPSLAWEIIALHVSILLEQGHADEARAVAEAGVQELERLG